MSRWFGAVLMAGVVAATAAAQIHGVPASVTSMGTGATSFTPGIPASVTSLGPAGFTGGRIVQKFDVPHRRVPRFATPIFFPWFTSYEPAPQPVVVVVEQPAPVVVMPERESENRPPELVILERDGDRYVRRNYSRVESSETEGEEEYAAARPSRRSRPAVSDRAARKKSAPGLPEAPRPESEERARELQPAVLIFLDGTRSEVSNFAIVGPVLYDLSDRRSRKIQLAELDLPATIAANDERGIAFRLPPASSPNQVITRP
ncbi:MAG TPA: hypothetical protein VNK82_13730 [Terriglobales bacterium]|nr:hypothetical protein [Terriglobales bacterium]